MLIKKYLYTNTGLRKITVTYQCGKMAAGRKGNKDFFSKRFFQMKFLKRKINIALWSLE